VNAFDWWCEKIVNCVIVEWTMGWIPQVPCVKAADALKTFGARKVVAYATHPVLSGKAIENLKNSVIDELVVTDTIPLSEEAQKPWQDSSGFSRKHGCWNNFVVLTTKNLLAQCSILIYNSALNFQKPCFMQGFLSPDRSQVWFI